MKKYYLVKSIVSGRKEKEMIHKLGDKDIFPYHCPIALIEDLRNQFYKYAHIELIEENHYRIASDEFFIVQDKRETPLEKALTKLNIPFSLEKTFTKNNFVINITENHKLEIVCSNNDLPTRYQDFFIYPIWLENDKKYSSGSRRVFVNDIDCLTHIVKTYESFNPVN